MKGQPGEMGRRRRTEYIKKYTGFKNINETGEDYPLKTN
jgi:hypothetical protein